MHDHVEHIGPSTTNTRLEYIKFVVVLVIVFLSTLGLTYLWNLNSLFEYTRVFMGVFMIVFASFKLLGYKMFVAMFPGYDLIATHSKAYSYAYPLIELSLGILALSDRAGAARNSTVIVLMGIGAVGVLKEIRKKGPALYCACLGNVIKLPLSTVSLVEDLLMVVLATYMLFIN